VSPRLRYLSTSLALVAVGLGYAVSQRWFERPAPRPITRSEAAVRPDARPPAPPIARDVLARGADLSLTADQQARLEALDLQWKGKSADLEVAFKEAEREFSQFMREAQAGGKTSLQDIQRRSADLQSLSAALRERRQIHSEAAARILTATQRQKLFSGTSPEPLGGIR